MLVVDTHTHVVSDDEDTYPLHPRDGTGPWYREDPCSVERLLGLLDDHDVAGAVLVQAISAYRFDNRYALDHAAAHGDVRELLGDLVDRFGADRLMWGSDYSQTHDRPYGDVVEYARHAASKLRDDDRDAFLAGTARSYWPELA